MKYGIDPKDLRRCIVVPVLEQLDLTSHAAVSLVLGTAMHESHLSTVRQVNGPALGFWQMEPATHDDCWRNYLFFRRELAARIRWITGIMQPSAEDMARDNFYACAMARVRYRRVPAGMPGNDPRALATYWKDYYNTKLGRGTVEEALPHFELACSFGS